METVKFVQQPSSNKFISLIKNPLKFRLFLLQKLPAAYFSGLKIMFIDDNRCEVSVPYKWFSKNPFQSTYFACLSMAAEMTTGILAMANIYNQKPKVSMLVVAIEGKFYKKAIDRTVFTCKEGLAIRQAIEEAIQSGKMQTIKILSSGCNQQNELIADFWITWSFKVKQ